MQGGAAGDRADGSLVVVPCRGAVFPEVLSRGDGLFLADECREDGRFLEDVRWEDALQDDPLLLGGGRFPDDCRGCQVRAKRGAGWGDLRFRSLVVFPLRGESREVGRVSTAADPA